MLSHTVSGTEIRKRRELAGVSVVALAKAVGITADYLYKIERGAKQPGATTAGRIADFFEVDIEDLLSEDPREDKAVKAAIQDHMSYLAELDPKELRETA